MMSAKKSKTLIPPPAQLWFDLPSHVVEWMSIIGLENKDPRN